MKLIKINTIIIGLIILDIIYYTFLFLMSYINYNLNYGWWPLIWFIPLSIIVVSSFEVMTYDKKKQRCLFPENQIDYYIRIISLIIIVILIQLSNFITTVIIVALFLIISLFVKIYIYNKYKSYSHIYISTKQKLTEKVNSVTINEIQAGNYEKYKVDVAIILMVLSTLFWFSSFLIALVYSHFKNIDIILIVLFIISIGIYLYVSIKKVVIIGHNDDIKYIIYTTTILIASFIGQYFSSQTIDIWKLSMFLFLVNITGLLFETKINRKILSVYHLLHK